MIYFFPKLWKTLRKNIELCPANMKEKDWHAVRIFSLMVSEGIESYLMFNDY